MSKIEDDVNEMAEHEGVRPIIVKGVRNCDILVSWLFTNLRRWCEIGIVMLPDFSPGASAERGIPNDSVIP